MNTNQLTGIILLSLESLITLITCIALLSILILGKKRSWWVFRRFVEMNGDRLVPWHFWFFVIQFIIIITGILLVV